MGGDFMTGTGSTSRRSALVVGSSDGIGLALSRRLLDSDWMVTGISRSPAPIDRPNYQHVVLDVTDPGYATSLAGVCDQAGAIDLAVYCAGVGELLRADELTAEARVFSVNLIGAVSTIEVVLTRMIAAGHGHFIGLSSLADRLISAEAPSYSASKAGLSSYLCGLALAVRPRNVYVTNVRFGFVDTKMAKAPRKPLLISADQAADVLMRCVRTRPVQMSYPKRTAMVAGLLGWLGTIRTWLG